MRESEAVVGTTSICEYFSAPHCHGSGVYKYYVNEMNQREVRDNEVDQRAVRDNEVDQREVRDYESRLREVFKKWDNNKHHGEVRDLLSCFPQNEAGQRT